VKIEETIDMSTMIQIAISALYVLSNFLALNIKTCILSKMHHLSQIPKINCHYKVKN